MNFIVKKTNELTEEEIDGILDLFNDVFNKNRSKNELINQYVNNPFGYSYHSMIIDDNIIVGCDTYIPSYYFINCNKYVFANAVDTMIKKTHRDFFNLYDMVHNLHEKIKSEGIYYVYGFPNDNAYEVFIKGKLMFDIGKLDTYFLPYRIGGIKPKLRGFNFLSKSLSTLYLNFNSLFSSKQIKEFNICKEQSTYNITRYKRMDSDYNIIHLDNLDFVYKIKVHEGIRTAFLIDVFQKSEYNINRAIKYIVKNEKNNFDLLLYIGHLSNFGHLGMIKMPKKYEPKNFNFTGIILDKDKSLKPVFYNIDNWDINLSNYDLI